MLLCEKYRPKIFEDVVGLPAEIPALVASDNLPHFLFVGGAGVGKTTVARIIVKTLGSDCLMLNSSEERGIDTIRDKVKNFARTMSTNGKIKIVFLDEVDGMCLPPNAEIIVGTKENPKIIKIKDMCKQLKHSKRNRLYKIPSVNIITRQIENDTGIAIDSGEAFFYELELEDGRKIIASENHPFFLKDLQEIQMKNIQIGDNIADFSDDVYNTCKICGKPTFNKMTCSVECQNKFHGQNMMGEKNPRFGEHLLFKTKMKIKNTNKEKYKHEYINPMKGKKRPDLIKLNKLPRTEITKKRLSESHKGKIYDDYNRAIRSKYGIDGFKDSNFRRYLKGFKKMECEDCGKECDVKGAYKGSIYIHHRDGNHQNNKRENLKFVCPKCHNTIEHDCRKRFLEKGWKITHGGNK